jgi:hypothetical protein
MVATGEPIIQLMSDTPERPGTVGQGMGVSSSTASRRSIVAVVVVASVVASVVAFLVLTFVAGVSLCGLFGCSGGWGSGGQRDLWAPVPWIVGAAIAGSLWALVCPWAWNRRVLVAGICAVVLGCVSAALVYFGN